MTRRLMTLVLTFAVFACASGPAPDKQTPEARDAERSSGVGGYSPQGGDKPVGVIPDVTFRDEKRQKDIEITIEYPVEAGSYPLIVWSHGFGGSNRGYVGLSSYWASSGYVVIKPTHADSGKLAGMKSAEEIWQSQTAADWKNRVADVVAILDAVPQLEEKFPELKGKMDAAHVGVGGHSYGAHTAMLIGGAKTFPDGTSYADPRVKAIIAMSPQGPSDQRGLTNDSYATLKGPALFMTGSEDRGVTDAETPEWRRQAFELSPAGDKFLIVLKGAQHATFAGRVAGMADASGAGRDVIIPDVSPAADPRVRGGYVPATGNPRQGSKRDPQLTERAIFNRVKVVSVAFWDAYLHGNAKGKDFIEKLAGRETIEMVKK